MEAYAAPRHRPAACQPDDLSVVRPLARQLTIFANCHERGVPSYCDQIHRDPTTHRITSVDQFLQNVTRTTTSGVDLARCRWSTMLRPPTPTLYNAPAANSDAATYDFIGRMVYVRLSQLF